MPELPDVTVYVERLEAHAAGRVLESLALPSPFVLRSVAPPVSVLEGGRLRRVSRLGKRIVLHFEAERFLVLHLMIAGRLRWRGPADKLPRANVLARLQFRDVEGPVGTLLMTEASKRRRASMHLVEGRAALDQFERGGLEVEHASPETFARRLVAENHTLKRALTDPRILSGIGNAYSDEILFRAKLSPFRQTGQLDDSELRALYCACREVLAEWTARLRSEVGEGFPEKVTAFRDGMAVHGRYRQPCPECGQPVQRIVYAQSESNYCARCQTGGRLLADRALSRLLKKNWPRTLEELEAPLSGSRAR